MNSQLDLQVLNRSLARGLGFLESAIGSDGLWHDFQTVPGASNEWVTGFILASTAGLLSPGPTALQAARSLLVRARPQGGWGYNEQVSRDCDSTAWVLQGLLPMPFLRPVMVRRALEVLLEHQGADGGFVTYQTDDPPDVVARGPRAEWFRSQPCVTAAALLTLLAYGEPRSSNAVVRAADYLEATCSPAGLWASDWWSGLAYPTLHAALALVWTGRLGGAELDRCLEAACAAYRIDDRSIDEEDGGWAAFDTAGILLLLLLSPGWVRHSAVLQTARYLLDLQRADGSWPPRPILRIPESLPGTTELVADDGGTFVTALSIKALAQLRGMLAA